MQTIIYADSLGMRCYLTARAKYLRIGAGYAEGSREVYPFIEVSYSLSDLLPLAALFADMDKRHMQPEIFAWDLDMPEPELLVLFRIGRPDGRLLEKILGRTGSMLVDCAEILATGETNIGREGMLEFLEYFDSTGGGLVNITEPTPAAEGYSEPLHVFTIQKIERRRPELFSMEPSG